MVSIILLFITFIATIRAQQFHQHMSDVELKDIFQISHTSEIPHYELVSVRHKINKRNAAQVIEARISSQRKTLFLNPSEGILAGKNTKIWLGKTKKIEEELITDMKFKLIPNVMEDVGEFFHDLNNGAALRMRRDANGHTLWDGTFGSEYMIRSLPERHRKNCTLVPCNFMSFEKDKDDFLTTYHHIIYKIDDIYGENNETQYYTLPMEIYSGPADVVYPEILVVVDEGLFSKFNGNVKNAVSYLLTFWNAVDLRYRNLNSPKVRLNIAGIVLMEGPLEYSNGYLEENGSKSYLLNLLLPQTGFYFIHRWAAVNEAYFDMVVLTTGHQLLNQIQNNVTRKDEGGAYFQGACNFTYSIAVGVFRDNGGFQGLTSGSHEIGHLLGAPHDIDYTDDDCKWDLGYMMSYVNGSERRVRLNRCNQRQMRDFLNSDKALCLRNPPFTDEPIEKFLPGKLMTLDEQCMKKTGHSACDYGEKHCVQLHCKEIKDNKEICSAFEPAAEGSKCGNKKYCLNAECVDESTENVPNLFTYLD